MESDHALAQYRFSETIPIAIGNKFLAATSGSLSLDSAALSIPSSPSPKQVVVVLTYWW